MTEPTLPPPPPLHSGCALFLDIDGCLLDFAETPEAVVVPVGLSADLMALRDRLGGALALVSGRSLVQIDALFPELACEAAGLHGLELRCTPGRGEPDALQRNTLAQLRQAAQAVADAHPGAQVEDKGVALALHWRAQPAAGPGLQAVAEAWIGQLPGYRLQPGNCVVEIRPDGHHKGTAIAHMMARAPFSGRHPVFAGDDFTDEDGFATVNGLGGTSIVVGTRRPTVARYALPGTQALRGWVGDAVRQLGAAA